jgi:hypothetical protein
MKTFYPFIICWLLCMSGTWAQNLQQSMPAPIPREVETAYLKGLRYLVGTQRADGSWPDEYGSNPAVVGLAVVAMLAHGDDPNTGPYHEAIHRGIRFIISKANRETGQIGGSGPNDSMYSHGFATLALAETYGVVDEPGIGPVLQGAVNLILAAQKRNPEGAWRYSPDAQDADSTVAGAQMVALFAARNAGLNVPDEAIAKGLKYFESCQKQDGGIAYQPSNLSPNPTLTSIGMVVYTLARQKETPFYQAATTYFKQNFNNPSRGHEFYHAYYASQAAFHCDEQTWQAWNTANIRRLLPVQTPQGSWTSYYGDSFATSAALLSLALNYRYLPIYER